MMYLAIMIAKHIVTYCYQIGKPVSNLKLQKLLYYVWIEYYKQTGSELFIDNMYAWQLGPVVPNVYNEFCQYAGIPIRREYNPDECAYEDAKIIDAAINKYIDYPTSTLVEMTHQPGKPWDVIKSERGLKEKIPFSLIIGLECRQ